MSRVSNETSVSRVERAVRAAAWQILDMARDAARQELLAELSEVVTPPPANGHAKSKTASPVSKTRKKGPIQLCPVPKCTNRAAPVFGMVCVKHKGLPKAQIKKYREARRAAKN
jgi:hypothetical protein